MNVEPGNIMLNVLIQNSNQIRIFMQCSIEMRHIHTDCE